MIVGVSLKMYFDVARTTAWCEEVLRLLPGVPAVADGRVEVWVLPSLPAIPAVLAAARGSRLQVGAQDLFQESRGAYTGAVSGADLAELGCRYACVGHAERRRYFGDDDDVVAAKAAAAEAAGLTPVVCIGEATNGPTAVTECLEQLEHSLSRVKDPSGVVVAYEPHWAIGAAEPATTEHIVEVCAALRDQAKAPVIYGGSAGPGLLTRLGGGVDGLFLGRFAHDPAAFAGVLAEAAA